MASVGGLSPNRAGHRCASANSLGVPDIDWDAPWLADWRAVGEPIARQVAAGVPQPEALNAAGRAPLRFVPQADLPEGQAYEDFIFATGQLPTREGLHYFINAIWSIHFAAPKKRLNQVQARENAPARVGAGTVLIQLT